MRPPPEQQYRSGSGTRSVVLTPVAYVPTLRRGGVLPRRVQGTSKHARTSGAALSVSGTISRSSYRAVRLLHPSPIDIAGIQRWTLDRVKSRASTASTSWLCTGAITSQTPWTTYTGASLGVRLELCVRAFPGPPGTFCADRRVSEKFGFE